MSLELAILNILKDAHPNMMRARTILGEVRMEPKLAATTQADFGRAIDSLEAKAGGAQIFGISGDDGAKYKITPEGLARLAGA